MLVIQEEKTSDIHSGIFFLDIKKAFDRVDTRTLISDLHSHGLRGTNLFAIQNILSRRFVRVFYQDDVAESYSPEEGTPQGGILSPLPWNFYFRKVAEAAEKCFSKPSFFGFADDVAIVVLGTSQHDVFAKLVPVYQRVRVWASLYQVQFSDSKVQCVHIAPNRYKRPHFNQECPKVLYENLEGKVV